MTLMRKVIQYKKERKNRNKYISAEDVAFKAKRFGGWSRFKDLRSSPFLLVVCFKTVPIPKL